MYVILMNNKEGYKMEFTLKITMADPAGNRTAFAEGDVPPELYAAVGAAILKEEDLNAEQAGFILPPLRGAAGRMEMMGGEFCGNASRSFGLLLGRRGGMKAGERVPVEVSGSRDILEVLLEDDGSWVSMPLPQAITELTLPEEAGKDSGIASSDGSGLLRFPAVVLEGITHVILENVKPSESLAHAVLDKMAKETDVDAAGAIFINEGEMTPVVWVRATDSFIWESSCGSGTLASTVWLGRDVKDGDFRLELKQPGGVLKAEFTAKEGRITDARIGGPVFFEEPVIRTITL